MCVCYARASLALSVFTYSFLHRSRANNIPSCGTGQQDKSERESIILPKTRNFFLQSLNFYALYDTVHLLNVHPTKNTDVRNIKV